MTASVSFVVPPIAVDDHDAAVGGRCTAGRRRAPSAPAPRADRRACRARRPPAPWRQSLSAPSFATSAAKSAAHAGIDADDRTSARQDQQGTGERGESDLIMARTSKPDPAMVRRRPTVPAPRAEPGPDANSVVIFRCGAVAADPGIGPVGDFALVLGQIRAPGVGLDHALGLPDDVELAIRPGSRRS